jgi:protein arginine kinase activator
MKCDKCEKPATFHITERVGEKQEWEDLHFCEECAREYLSKSNEVETDESLAGALAQHLKMSQTAEDFARLDQCTCPICGITFYEFRHHGRLGCPHDYICFEEQLEPLIVNIHGETDHTGKRPKRSADDLDRQTQLIRLRRDMREAVQAENYERASELRDEIRRIEGECS